MLNALAIALIPFTCVKVDGPVAAFAGFSDRFLEPAEELVQREIVPDRVLGVHVSVCSTSTGT